MPDAPATTARTLDDLADAIIADHLQPTYDLVFVNYDDSFTDEQVAAIVRGDYETLWESTGEWESDARYDSAATIIKEAAGDAIRLWSRTDAGDIDNGEHYDQLVDDFEGTDAWERVREAVEERDSGNWPKELARLTPDVLLRIPIEALDEDHAFSFEPVTAEQVLTRLGLTADAHNLEAVSYALANASPEFSTLMGYWIIAADVEQLYNLPGDTDHGDMLLDIEGPHLYLGNPFAGSGFITETALHGTVTVRRDQLRTDKDAFGYSVNEVYGGLSARDFTAVIRPATITVSLTIGNHYELHPSVTTNVTDVTVPAPPPAEPAARRQQWATEHLLPFTGTGHTDGDSSYDIVITGSSNPDLVGATFTFG